MQCGPGYGDERDAEDYSDERVTAGIDVKREKSHAVIVAYAVGSFKNKSPAHR